MITWVTADNHSPDLGAKIVIVVYEYQIANSLPPLKVKLICRAVESYSTLLSVLIPLLRIFISTSF